MGWPDDPITCTVHQAKITEYLLNLDHAHGAAKARFFLAFGYRPDYPEILSASLLVHAHPMRLTRDLITAEGKRKLVFVGPIQAPDGRQPWIRTVGQINDAGEAAFVTAVPVKGRSGPDGGPMAGA